jgi:hypothetical protein
MHAAKKFSCEKMLAAFWKKIDKRGPDECWPWIGAKQRAGYGHFRDSNKKTITASRFAWELVNGPIPEGMHALHNCDNRACCNPAHIRAGTQRENMFDMQVRRRNPVSQLTAEQVREIRAVLKTRRFGAQKELATKFGVSNNVISKLKKGQTYLWVN